jgi:pyruvate dehydrogenase E2 component (dihydrolipoamide acetyltransferase)
MATAVRMPRWGMIMEEGILQTWLKKEGQAVSQGDPIAEVESDKAVKEIEAPASGVVARIVVGEGETVPIGTLLAVIRETGEGTEAVETLLESERGASDVRGGQPSPADQPVQAQTADSQAAGRPERRISPAARHLAERSGIEWKNLPGTGPGRRIQIRDVQSALAGELPRGLSGLRQAIARRTTRSIAAPQAALCREMDLTNLLELRAARKREVGNAASLTAFLIQRIAAALREVPILNSTLLPQGHLVSRTIHMGVIVSTEGGIMVPVIRDVQDRSLEEIDAVLADYVQRARERSLRPEEMEGGTFTLSNAGPLGIDIFQPLLNPPEVAILGIGRIRERPTAMEGSIVARATAYFCLATDHRVVDAEPAGGFLRLLEGLITGSADPSRK